MLIGGRAVTHVISDTAWLEGDFISTVQQRGAAIIKARGLSSAASAANAAIDTVQLCTDTPAGDGTASQCARTGATASKKASSPAFPSAAPENGKSSRASTSATSARAASPAPLANSRRLRRCGQGFAASVTALRPLTGAFHPFRKGIDPAKPRLRKIPIAKKRRSYSIAAMSAPRILVLVSLVVGSCASRPSSESETAPADMPALTEAEFRRGVGEKWTSSRMSSRS